MFRNFLFFFFVLVFSITSVIGQQSDTTQLKSKKTNFSIFPVVGYEPDTEWQFGVIAFFVNNKNKETSSSEFYRPTSFSPYIIYTIRNQILISLDMDLFLKKGSNLNTKLRIFDYPDFYYGIGNRNNPDSVEKYANRYVRLNGRWMKPLNNKLFVGVGFDLQTNELYDLKKDGELIKRIVNGSQGGENMGIGPTMVYDSRNSSLYPSNGTYFITEFVWFTKYFGGDYNYARFMLDFRKYYKIKNEKNIIAFHALGAFTIGDDIPFYKLPKLAGDDKLRGFENSSLYIDKQSYLFQVEYRRWLFWRLGGVAFAGFGDVLPSLGDFSKSDVKGVFGLGGRYQALKKEKFNIRLDAGITSNGQMAFYLSVREAF